MPKVQFFFWVKGAPEMQATGHRISEPEVKYDSTEPGIQTAMNVKIQFFFSVTTLLNCTLAPKVVPKCNAAKPSTQK